MALQTQSLSTLVSNFAATVQGRASQLVNFTVGSVLRSVGEATSGVALWLQGQVLQTLSLTRATTSSGADLDSWLAQFGFSRFQAVAATGQATFSRFTPTLQAVVPVGQIVQTGDGSQQFQVIADAANAAYNATLGGFVIGAGTASVTVTVQALTPGSGGNVAPASVTVLSQAIPYVDTVTNAAGFTGGVDAESDAAALARFVTWVNSLSRATKSAIGSAIQGVQQNLAYQIFENVAYDGSARQNYFYAVVDDGTGNPPAATLNAITAAISAARPIGTTFNVYAPVVVNAVVSMNIVTAQGYVHGVVAAQVQQAIQSYINTLPIGATLPYAKLTQLAFTASMGVANVTGVTLNGGTADLTCTMQQVIKTNSVTVN
jgi:uncharacterized phage protein gp47/JayE